MKAAKIVIRILVILLTSVWGAVFGILIPFILMGTAEQGMRGICLLWIFMSAVGYFAPCFLVMLDFKNAAKIAVAFSLVGTVITIFLHNAISEFYSASYMYMPQICMSFLTIINLFVINSIQKSGKNNAPAPSILSEKENI